MKSKVIALILLLFGAGVLLSAAQTAQLPNLPKKVPTLERPFVREGTNGSYAVSVWKDGGWREAGRLPFGQSVKERELDLSAWLPEAGAARVRLVPEGPGAAHIDAVTLGGTAPTGTGSGEAVRTLKKLSARDNDLIGAAPGGLELTFGAAADKTLRLAARLEPAKISKIPFKFPAANAYRPVTPASEFFMYSWNAQKPPAGRPGSGEFLQDVGKRTPLFKVQSTTGSGHPEGTTYGWASNDADNLYVTVDFTLDNTMDGDKDYAKLYVPVNGAVKGFKVSVPETKWGQSQFTYTDKVAYEHKVYHFVIPRAEIGDPADAAAVPIIVEAYGTAAMPYFLYRNPAAAYDPDHNRYLFVQEYAYGEGGPFSMDIWAVLVDADGNMIDFGGEYGGWIPIAEGEEMECCPDVAYDRQSGRFLVVWQTSYGEDYSDIHGQLVGWQGDPIGDRIDVATDEYGLEYFPAVANDPVNHRFLVAFEYIWDAIDADPFDSHIFGQFVGPDGEIIMPAGWDLRARTQAAADYRFPISMLPMGTYRPDLAFDSELNGYLVAFEVFMLYGGGPIAPQKFRRAAAAPGLPFASVIGGQYVAWNGAPLYTNVDENFPISDIDSEDFLFAEAPTVANDSVHHRFMTAWTDGFMPDGGPLKKPQMRSIKSGTPGGLSRRSSRGDSQVHKDRRSTALQAGPQTRGTRFWANRPVPQKVNSPIPGFIFLWDSYVFGQVLDIAGNLVLPDQVVLSDTEIPPYDPYTRLLRTFPDIAFDSFRQQFLVFYFNIWDNTDANESGGYYEGRTVDAMGGIVGDPIPGGYDWWGEDLESGFGFPSPALAYNTLCHNFLLATVCYCEDQAHWELIGEAICATLPEVTTAAVSQIKTTSAVGGGLVLSDGGAEVTARGICWNTTGSPTVSDPHTTDGTGTGSFVSQMTGLTPGTTYYVRAYAVNAMGTVYGDEKTFMTYKYIVKFVAGTGGTVTGELLQYLYEGGNCTPVEAKAGVGFCFINWTGPEGFAGTSTNPLTVTGVHQDMTITANFGKLSLAAQKLTERAWIVKNYYGKIVLTLDGLDPAVSLKYVLYRKTSDAAFASIKEFTKADIKNGAITYEDQFLKASTTYVYYFAAYNGEGQEVGRSEEITVK